MAMTPALAFTFMVLNPFKNFSRGSSIESLIHLVAVRSGLGSGRATAATLQFIAMVTPPWAAALVCAIDWGLRRNIFTSHVPLV